MHTGTSQAQRLAAPLDWGLAEPFLRPDEMTLATRLRLTLALGTQLRFVDERGLDQGHWGEVLGQDLSFVLAHISGHVHASDEARLMAQWPSLSPQQQWGICQQLADRLHGWRLQMGSHLEPPTSVSAHLLSSTPDPRRAATDPAHLAQRWLQLWQAHMAGELGRLLAQLQRVFDTSSQKTTMPSRVSAESLAESVGVRDLRQLCLGLCRAQRQLAMLASELLPASLHTGQHDPAMGALLAFVQLLQASRAPLDDFTRRLTQYYHGERLGFAPVQAGADRVHLLLERDPRQNRPVVLPQGACFVGGKDERGQLLRYRAEQALELSDLKVTQLLALRLDADPRTSPEHEWAYATQARALVLQPPTPEQAAQPHARAWPLLGGGEPGSDFVQARQGLALASSLLYLSEGEREIELQLQLGHPANHDPQLQGLLTQLSHHALRQASDVRADWLDIFDCIARYEKNLLSLNTKSYARETRTPQMAHLLDLLPARSPGQNSEAAPSSGVWLSFLLALCLDALQPEHLRQRLGRFFAVWITCQEELAPVDLQALRKHAQRVLGDHRGAPVQIDNPLSLIYGHQPMERSLIFDRVFRGLWQPALSTADGWFTPGEVYVRLAESDSHGAGRLLLQLKLSASAPAIQACRQSVHGNEWPALPVLQLCLSNQTRVFGYSLLEQLKLDAVHIQVRATGLRQLLLYNQLGRLDASKPFQPFGPLPDRSAYLLFSHTELATKPLCALTLDLHWADLPSAGLAAHYAAYAQGAQTMDPLAKARSWDEASFVVKPAMLHAASWQECRTRLPLFAAQGARQHLSFDDDDLRRLHQPTTDSAPSPLAYSLASRQGFFRLQFDGPESAFGHAMYPRLLSHCLIHNSRLKQLDKHLAPPPEPYTPRLEHIRLSYTAQTRIAAPTNAQETSHLLHITPFGVQAQQASGPGQCHLLAPWRQGAELFIGLSGHFNAGVLSLLFQLQAEQAAEALARPSPKLHWAAWCGQQWRALKPHQVLMDSTEGLLRTGIIRLDLPEDMSADCPQMCAVQTTPLLWLRLSASEGLARLAPIQGIWAQAVSARRERTSERASGPITGLKAAPSDKCVQTLPANSLQAVQPAIAGLVRVQQPLPSFELRQPETEAQMHTRAAERLRHRDRALTPWDLERLVLHAFPEVQKLKCIPLGGPGPGRRRVLLVVVPALASGRKISDTAVPRLDAAALSAITAFVQKRSPPGSSLLVRNATYDRIQVRCQLKLKNGFQQGEYLRQLHQAVREYLSPWRPGGITASFDWVLRADEIEALLRAQPGVDSVGAVSLLHIVCNDQGRYRLQDSARGTDGPQALNLITPSQPWSLALPTRTHLLELSDTASQAITRKTGLARLTLGSSFIIGAART